MGGRGRLVGIVLQALRPPPGSAGLLLVRGFAQDNEAVIRRRQYDADLKVRRKRFAEEAAARDAAAAAALAAEREGAAVLRSARVAEQAVVKEALQRKHLAHVQALSEQMV